ncbi:hypothetical protein GC163_06645 [bacterium]|nr:hypothetical protein [bacterium]
MNQVIPPRFLFRWSFPVPYDDSLPGSTTGCAPISDSGQLPKLDEFDGAPSFARWQLAWNTRGLGIAVDVAGKKLPVTSDLLRPTEGDAVFLWIDTRCTQNVHRATRFCHRFCILPAGMGRKKQDPSVIAQPLAQAREETGKRGEQAIQITSTIRDDGYRIDLWFPPESLHGFDPSSHPRLGFYGLVHDTELGDQPLTVGPEFPIDFDPSMWQTLELVR